MKRLLNAAFHSFLFAWLFSLQVYGQDNPQGKKSPGPRATIVGTELILNSKNQNIWLWCDNALL